MPDPVMLVSACLASAIAGFCAAWALRAKEVKAFASRLADRTKDLALVHRAILFLGRVNNHVATLRFEDQVVTSIVLIFRECFPDTEINLFSFDEDSIGQGYADGHGGFHVMRHSGSQAGERIMAFRRFASVAEKDWQGPVFLPVAHGEGLRLACVPLIAGESLVGAMLLRSREPVSEAGKSLYFDLSQQVALSLQTARMRQRTDQLRDAFSRAVDSRVAKKLIETTGALGGSTMDATALFLDIRDFTSFSEFNPPEYVVARLNDFFLHMERCVTEEGGLINKFLGDGFMALFGATQAADDHAARALRAAAAMVASARGEWNAEKGFRVGIGIASGPMLIGTVGTPSRLEFTAIGDTVNTASRLEAQNKQRGTLVLASRATVDAAKATLEGALSTRVVGDIALKGKASSVEIHEVLEVAGIKVAPQDHPDTAG